MKELTLEEMQEKETDLLCWFKLLCETNGLYYTLAGGTLLGAVRHSGFIPWDDDIDVLMPRADFDRLLSMEGIDTTMLPAHVQISSWRSPDGEPYPFIKLLDRRIHVRDKYSHADSYLWIDIFPMDGCPADEKEVQRLYNRILFHRRVLLLKSARLGEGKSTLKKIAKPFLKLALALLPVKTLCDRYDEMAKACPFDGTPYVAGITWGYGPRERVDREAWMTPVPVRFGGNTFNAPSNFHEYLSNLYGEYMQLPPEDQRQTRHDIIVYMKNE